ncbi:hypothetical protein NMG60_11018146 [Bertholletia excelsa]
MAPSRVAGGLAHSSSSSGIHFQGDGLSQSVGNPHLSSSFGTSSNSIQGVGRSNLGPVSGDASNTVLNSGASSGPSVGASSLVTDANSGLSGGPHLQRSASFNTESYMRLPASPLSFSSNNISISGSSVMDVSSVVQQGSNQDPCSQKAPQSQQQHGASTATSVPTSRMGQVSLPSGPLVPGSFVQDPNNITQLQKKPRLDIKQEDIMPKQVLQQLLQRQDSMQIQTRDPQLQALIHQRLRQQQFLQSISPVQRAHLLQQQQQHQQQQQLLQLRQQLQQQGMQQMSTTKRPHDSGVCSRRLMQYLYHQRQRPHDNTIAYWRKFVAEYYSTCAKKRWCLSLYSSVGSHSLGVFPPTTTDAWHCDICGSKSGRGFEATFDVLPRLNEIKFGSGVIDELLFLDMPREYRSHSGLMVLEYGKAVQESVYEQLRVVREGLLRITFAPDLKILTWEFCARRHEEILPRKLVAPQVNQLLQVAQKCQSTIADSGSDRVSQQDLQTNSNMVMTAWHQLARTLELQSLNDLGFSKRYVRCLQIAEVVNSMKDLMDFCRRYPNLGPIEGLKNYPRRASATEIQKMDEMEQPATIQDLPTDRNTLNKFLALQPGLNGQMTNNPQMVGRGALSGSAQAAWALTTYQNLVKRQNSMNSNSNSLQPEASSSFNTSNTNPSSTFQGPTSVMPGAAQNLHVSGFSNSLVPQQQQGSQIIQQQMIQKLLQGVNSNNGEVTQQHSLAGKNANGNLTIDMARSGMDPRPSRSNSFKAASNSNSTPPGGDNGVNQKTPDLKQSLHLSEEMVQDIAHEFTDHGFFNNDLDDNLDFDWKA